jgi:renin receptor
VANPAEFYRDQYPALFNIFFWLTLILAVTIYAIAYNMWYMDPGLDTVIYRMTSQRIKKDQ